MKKLIAIILSAFMLLNLVACGGDPAEETKEESKAGEAQEEILKEEEEKEEKAKEKTEETTEEAISLKVGAPKAPPTLPVLHMIEEKTLGENVNLELDIWNDPEQLIAMVQDNEHDMFAFPLTVVAKLNSKGVPVTLMNVNTWGVTYFMTSDKDFKSWEDLRGKTVYIPLQSSPPDALTQYFLNEAGLKVGEDVNIVYASMPEVTSALVSGEAEYATVIEPQCTIAHSKNENLITAFSFEDEWKKATGTDTMIPNAGWGAKNSFIEEHPEFTEKFQEAYKESLEWVLANPKEASELAEKYLDMPAPIIEQAIPRMGLHFKTAVESEEELDMFYNLLNDFDPKMIGGKLPDKSMYYNHE